jgi:hypothetical protein
MDKENRFSKNKKFQGVIKNNRFKNRLKLQNTRKTWSKTFSQVASPI